MSNIVLAKLGENIKASTAGQVATSSGSTTAPALVDNTFSFRNKIINGDLRIDQRYDGAAQTFTNPSQEFVADRFRFGGSSGTGLGTWGTRRILLTYPTAPEGFLYSMRLTVNAIATSTGTAQKLLSHQIEGSNVIDTNWGDSKAVPCTLSFWVRSTIAGVYPLVVSNGREPAGQPSGYRQQYLTSYTINAANTWEYKQIVIPRRTSGTFADVSDLSSQGIRIDWVVGSRTDTNASAGIVNNWFAVPNPSTNSEVSYNIAGSVNLWLNSGAQWQVTGVQFEKGSVATAFEQRPIGTELALCQRYYQRRPSTYITNQYSAFPISYAVPMRIAPQITWGSTFAAGYPLSITDQSFTGLSTTNASALLQLNAEL